MTGTPPRETIQEEDSQLNAFQRVRLYMRKPADAFSIISRSERRKDALIVFILYFIVRAPIVIQKLVAQGKLDTLDGLDAVLVSAFGIFAGVVLSVIFMFLVGLFFHLVLNVILKSDRVLEDAMIMPVLCLAPQLILVFELPSLFLHFRDYQTYQIFLVLRIGADVLSVRTFYWGVRNLFGLSKNQSIAVTLIPGIPVGLMVLGLLMLILK